MLIQLNIIQIKFEMKTKKFLLVNTRNQEKKEMKKHVCICCATQLLQHLNQNKSYLFCPNCSQEMYSSLGVSECVMPKGLK